MVSMVTLREGGREEGGETAAGREGGGERGRGSDGTYYGLHHTYTHKKSDKWVKDIHLSRMYKREREREIMSSTKHKILKVNHIKH